MSKRHNETNIEQKLKKSEEKAKKYKEKIISLNGELRRARQKQEETNASRNRWKDRFKSLKSSIEVKTLPERRYIKVIQEIKLSEEIADHKYKRHIVSICISLYALSGCSLRGVIRVLTCLQLELGIKLEDIPSKSSVQNWIQKLGYYEYTHYDSTTYEGNYGLIIDECMVIGQQRMIIALGLPSDKTVQEATKLGDVRLLYISVQSSWNHVQVSELLQKVTEKMGKSPEYVISDGAGNLKKGIHKSKLVRISDIGHEMGKILEQTYSKNDEYNAFTKAAALVKFKEVMKDTSYLLPPKQRTIARFMNMSATVEWAAKMLNAFERLTPNEQQVFAWLKTYRSLIKELENTFDLAHLVMKTIKNKGLSYQNIEECLTLINPFRGNVKLVVITKIMSYFQLEKDKLPNSETVWHASSDVIESLFGKYKSTIAANKLNGITPHVLSLCVLTHFDGQKELIHDTVRDALSDVSMSDLKTWKHQNLVDNQVVRRRVTLNS
jgi:hypothetical protein